MHRGGAPVPSLCVAMEELYLLVREKAFLGVMLSVNRNALDAKMGNPGLSFLEFLE